MERIAEAVPHSDDQVLQHFLTNSPWQDLLVVDQVADDANGDYSPLSHDEDSI